MMYRTVYLVNDLSKISRSKQWVVKFKELKTGYLLVINKNKDILDDFMLEQIMARITIKSALISRTSGDI